MKSVIALIAICGLAWSVLAGGAILERGEYIRDVSYEGYFPCFGEVVYTEFIVPVRYFVVETSSGNLTRLDKWLPNQLEGIIIGLESGNVWERTNTVVSAVTEESGGDASMSEYTFKSVMVNIDTGERMVVIERAHVSYDANGELRVEMASLKCHPAGEKPD